MDEVMYIRSLEYGNERSMDTCETRWSPQAEGESIRSWLVTRCSGSSVWRCYSQVHGLKSSSELLNCQAEDSIRYWSVTGVQTCAFFISSRRRHTRLVSDWSSDVCSSDLKQKTAYEIGQ